MTTSSTDSQAPALTTRMIYGSLILGQLLFAGVTFFRVRPNQDTITALPQQTVILLFSAAVAACALALLLRRRIPARSNSTSPDVFWTTAGQKALLTWMPLEAAGLFALAQYFASIDPIAIVAAAVPLTLLGILNPWLLERT